MSGPKEHLYDLVRKGSQNVKHLGQDLNIGFLESEGEKGEKNPGRALTKAAAAAATWYLGGAGAWGQGANAAAQGAVPAMAEMGGQTASELAQQMALQQSAGLMGSMESGLMNTGYTPSSLANLAKFGPESGQSFGQTLGNWAGNKATNLMHTAQNNPMGLLSGGGKEMGKRYALNQGLSMMQPPQQPQTQPMPLQYQQEPLQNPYATEDPFANLTEEEKMKLRMMGYQV